MKLHNKLGEARHLRRGLQPLLRLCNLQGGRATSAEVDLLGRNVNSAEVIQPHGDFSSLVEQPDT